MADLSKITRQIEFRSDTTGLDRIAASADKASASTKKLSDATTSLATASTNADKSVLSVANRMDRYVKANDPLSAALAKVAVGERLVAQARAQGTPITDGAARALANARAKVEELTRAHNEHTKSVGLNRSQVLELSHVARSLADDFAAGTLGVRSFAMEGGRLSQVLSEGQGGVSGTLRVMGGTVARLASGWLGLGAAVAAGAGLAAAAIIRLESQQDKLASSLGGSGRFAGVGVSGLASIANAAGARNVNLGQGGATDLAATLASTGRISAGTMPGIMDLTAAYSRKTGEDLTKTGDLMARSFADPAKGAALLSERLGFLNATTRDNIESMMRQGNLLGAQQELLKKSADAAQAMADRTWKIAGAWQSISGSVSRTLNSAGNAIEQTVNGDSPEQRMARAVSYRSGGLAPRTAAGRAIMSDNLTEDILQIRRGILAPQKANIDQAARDKATNDLSLSVADALKSVLPETMKTKELSDTLSLLNKALGDQGIIDKTPGGRGALLDARGRVVNDINNSNPLARIVQDSALSAQAAGASTAAERTLVEARRAELEVLRSTHDATQAAAKSLAVWTDEIARSNKEAEDALRGANQRAGLIGLSPLQRDLRENDYRYDEMRRNSVSRIVGALPGGAGDFTALSPFGDLDDASHAFGGKLTNRIIPTMHARSLAAYRQLNSGALPPASDVTVNPSPRASAVGVYAPAAARFAPGNISIPSTSAANLNAAQSRDAASIIAGATTEKLRLASEELQRNRQLLETRTKALGLDTSAMQKAVHEQEIWNDLQREGVTRQTIGAKAYDDMSIRVKRLAADQAAYDKQQQGYDRTVSASNWFQSTGNSITSDLGSSFGDLFNANPRNLVSQLKVGDQAKYYAGQLSGGQVKSKIFQMQAGNFLRNLMFQQGIGLVQKGLFGSGQYGSPGYQSGIFGGVFNSLLGGAGGLFGLGGGGGGGGGGGSLSGITSLLGGSGNPWGYALGGIMTSAGPVPLRKYAGGGVANSPQMAVFGEGSSPEAYVPLPDGRRIPVAMSGSHGTQINMQGHTIVVQGNADDKTAALIDQKLAAANRQMVADLQRNMGQMQAKWSQRNGS